MQSTLLYIIPAFPRPLSSCARFSHATCTLKVNRLGDSNISVSEVCLGTMTWGMKTTEAEAHNQIEYGISRGINFLDTAEIYPVPVYAPEYVPGHSEEIIGTYIARNQAVRDQLVIATKVMGYSPSSKAVANRRPGLVYEKGKYPARLDMKSVVEACDASLIRLQTDYIDLYQLHWPDRYIPSFGNREYRPESEREAIPIRETLEALGKLLAAGKIKAYGLSNESSFGLCESVRIADELGMPRPASIQNSFSLLNRSFEYELAEACAPSNYNIGLLPCSVLAGGTLTGKYNGKLDKNNNVIDRSISSSRFAQLNRFQVYFSTDAVREATENI